MISCALDEQGLRDQLSRQRRLAPSITGIIRDGSSLQIDFAPDLDRRLLDEMVAVEERCCPFFRFSFDERANRLTIGVADAQHAEALGAIAAALAPAAG